MSEDEEFVICGSENGRVCIWNKNTNEAHNGRFESFLPFNKKAVTSAQFAPLNILQKVSSSMMKHDSPAIVKQIIIATSCDGRIKVYYQTIELC